MPEMQKKLGVNVLVSEIKRAVNYTDFEKLSHIIEYKSNTEANSLASV